MRVMAAAAMMLVLAGCLTDGRRVGADGDSGGGDTEPDTGAGDTVGDTGDTVGPDTGFDTHDAPDADLCANRNCDDGDPCTYDQCNPTSGECEHLGVPGGGGAPLPGCTSDAECEDGDPCTTNSCTDMGCGAGGFCTTELVPGCNDCATGCNDQNPCTRDECRDQQCTHYFEEGCLPGCIEGQILPIAQIRQPGGTFDDPLKTTGELFFHELMRGCNDGPTCDCHGWPGLRDEGYDLVLRGQDAGSESWQCASTGCTTVHATCEPAQRGVSYRVWGRGLQEWELYGQPGGEPGAAVPAPMIAGVAVQDFCLETDGTSLVGSYDGVAEVGGYQLAFKAQFSAQADGRLRLAYEPSPCEACPINVTLEPFEGDIVVGDGWIEFEALLPNLLGTGQLETVRLYSNRNALIGRYGERAGGVVPFIALPPGGTLALTRLP